MIVGKHLALAVVSFGKLWDKSGRETAYVPESHEHVDLIVGLLSQLVKIPLRYDEVVA